MEAVSERPQLSYYKDGVYRTIDCSNVVFILVSDIGGDRIKKIIMAHDSRESIPNFDLVSAVKDSLDHQWKRLNFGEMIDQVVPFLPLEPTHIEEIIDLKLRQMDLLFRTKYWRTLTIKSGVSSLLATNRYVKYKKVFLLSLEEMADFFKQVNSRF